MNLLKRIVDVRPGEVRAMLWSCAYFFFLLSSYYIIRPIRDQMGVAGGVRNLPWLFSGTLLVTIIAQPIFASLVKRYPARRFIPITYHFFAFNLIGFFLLLTALPEAHDVWIGRAFFIWTSVFNMFVVSVFWAFMVDLFRTEQSKRLFGFIGVGGTAGGIVGGLITAGTAELVGTVNLLIVSAVLLELAVLFITLLARNYDTVRSHAEDVNDPRATTDVAGASEDKAIGGGVWAGFTHALRSPYLLMVCLYMLLFTITSTVLYLQVSAIADARYPDGDAQTAFFARIDLMINVLTVVTQAFITGRLLKWFGVAFTLSILPVISLIGFAGIAALPALGGLVIALHVARRAGNFAIGRPTREVLFTVVPREEKYKAKTFIDTTVYRTGDQIGAWSEKLLAAVGIVGIAGNAMVAVPLSAIWLATTIWLGRRQKVLQERMKPAADVPVASAR